jgi:hypothetical protein
MFGGSKISTSGGGTKLKRELSIPMSTSIFKKVKEVLFPNSSSIDDLIII